MQKNSYLKQKFNKNWYGLAIWSCYFFLKLGLYFTDKINFHAFTNLLFAIFLLVPTETKIMRRTFRAISLILALILFWYDSKLPGINSVIDNFSLILTFNLSYVADLIGRMVNWLYILYGVIAFVVFKILILNRKVSLFFTGITFIGLIGLCLIQYTKLIDVFNQFRDQYTDTSILYNRNQLAVMKQNKGDIPSILSQFYSEESTKQVAFPKNLPSDAQPFEILVLNICSLSWYDLQSMHLSQAPLLSKFDVLFTHFNSATSYSGPAALRLIHASCGQLTHQGLYSNLQCNLFNDLAGLGFEKELMLDYDGKFDEYLDTIRKFGDFRASVLSQQGIPVSLQAFDNSPLYDDQQLFDRWTKRTHQPLLLILCLYMMVIIIQIKLKLQIIKHV